MNTTLLQLLGFVVIVLVVGASVAMVVRNGPGQELRFVFGCALILGVSVLAVRVVNPAVSTTHLVWAGAATVISGLAWGAIVKLMQRLRRGR